MRMPSSVVVPAVLAAFACGLVVARLGVREARAQSSALASTIYVPSDGLAFRTFDGHVIAKLSYDAHGGIFEVFDEHERPIAGVRGDGFGSARPAMGNASPPPERSPRSDRPDLGF